MSFSVISPVLTNLILHTLILPVGQIKKNYNTLSIHWLYMDRVKGIWYLSPMRAAKVQASLRIRAVTPEPSLLAHTSSESRGTFRQKARSLAPLNGWACAVKICHDGMLEDTNSLDGAHMRSCNSVVKTLEADIIAMSHMSPVKRICVFEHSVMY